MVTDTMVTDRMKPGDTVKRYQVTYEDGMPIPPNSIYVCSQVSCDPGGDTYNSSTYLVTEADSKRLRAMLESMEILESKKDKIKRSIRLLELKYRFLSFFQK